MVRDEVQFQSAKLAVLIDADNANADLIEPLLKEVAKYGTAHVKRIYGDWTTPQLGKWKEKLIEFAIQPIQQFRYTTGKNATDSALIIDAMDLLYTRNFDGFCIVSSDSDFTKLAQRVREAGLVVYGFGEKKTPSAFIRMCDKFIYTEILGQSEVPIEISLTESTENIDIEKTSSQQASDSKAGTNTSQKLKSHHKLKNDEKLIHLLKDAYEATSGEDGWANLGLLGHNLTKLSPSFDSRSYGHKQLGSLVQAIEMFEVRKTPKGIHIKLKA